MKSVVFSALILAGMTCPALAQTSPDTTATSAEAAAGATFDGAADGGATERRGERFQGERSRRYSGPLPYDEAGYRGRFDGDVTYDGRWSGTWTGAYNGGPETVYKGTFDGDYRGTGPHGDPRARQYGYGYGLPYTITTTPQPVTTTTVTETEEWVPAAADRPATRKIYKPRTKALRR
jgi:hypothetical protein